MVLLKSVGVFLLPAIAAAIPASSPSPVKPGVVPNSYPTPSKPSLAPINSRECSLVNRVLTSLKALPTASSFCSNFLHISTITTTKTATSVSVIPFTVKTPTATATVTVNSVSKVTQTASSVSIVATTTTTFYAVVTAACDGGSAAKAKRGVLPSKLSCFASAQISTACKCLGIATPTKTVTVVATSSSTSTDAVAVTTTVTITQTGVITTTVTSIIPSTSTLTVTASITVAPTSCAAPPTCGNQGLQFAVYQNTDGPVQQATYPNWNPEGYKTATPEYQGTTASVGRILCYGFDPAACTIYDQYTRSTENFVVNHRGYLYAPQTGTYTFQVYQPVDNAATFWIGPKAYLGWTKGNADFDANIAAWTDPDALNDNVYRAELQAGHYYPFRVMFGQGGGAIATDSQGANLQFSATGPDGTSLNGSPFFVHYSCDGAAAPAFLPFGLEA